MNTKEIKFDLEPISENIYPNKLCNSLEIICENIDICDITNGEMVDLYIKRVKQLNCKNLKLLFYG